MARLHVVNGSLKGKEIMVLPHTVIGRAPGNAISINDDRASRQHAEIRKNGDGYVLADLKSGNGTYLNDEKLARPAHLRDGDRIRVGSTEFQFFTQPQVKVKRVVVRRKGVSPAVIIVFTLILLGIVWVSRLAAFQALKALNY